jgi:hypothetical protein
MQHAITLSKEPKKKFSVMRGHLILEKPPGFIFSNVDIYVAQYNASDTKRQWHSHLPPWGMRMSRRSLVSTRFVAREALRHIFGQHQTQRSSRVDSGCTATSIQQSCTEGDFISLVLSCSISGWAEDSSNERRRLHCRHDSWQQSCYGVKDWLLWMCCWFCPSVAGPAALLQ